MAPPDSDRADLVRAHLIEEEKRRPPTVVRKRLAVAIAVFSLLAPAVIVAETTDPNDDGSQHTWTENAGWVNAEPGGDGGPGMHIAADWIKGWLWSENLGWISLSCENTASCARVDYGVQHGSTGVLFGYAWSENAGWISFACENTGTCATVDYRVVIDLGTGELSGYAWAENTGWINLSCLNTTSCATVDFGVDTTVPFPEHLFFDGFESGDTNIWSTTVP